MINMRYFYKKKNIEKNKLIFCFLSRPLPVEQLAAAGNHKTYSKNNYHENIFLILILISQYCNGLHDNIFIILIQYCNGFYEKFSSFSRNQYSSFSFSQSQYCNGFHENIFLILILTESIL